MDRWKIFRRKSADAVAMVLKIDADNEQVVLDFDGEFQQMPPEVMIVCKIVCVRVHVWVGGWLCVHIIMCENMRVLLCVCVRLCVCLCVRVCV